MTVSSCRSVLAQEASVRRFGLRLSAAKQTRWPTPTDVGIAPTDGCDRLWFFGERNRPSPIPMANPMGPGFSGAVTSKVPGPKTRLTPDLIAMRKAPHVRLSEIAQ